MRRTITTESIDQSICMRRRCFFAKRSDMVLCERYVCYNTTVPVRYHSMSYNKRTNLFTQILFSRGMALVIIFLIVFLSYSVYSIAGKSIDASKARKLAEVQAASITEKETDLTAKLNTLDTTAGEEAALREQYPVVSPGEHVVIINDGSDDDATSPSDDASASSSGFWNYLKTFFKKTPAPQPEQ